MTLGNRTLGRWVTVASFAALVATGCGGGSTISSSTSAPTTTQPPVDTLAPPEVVDAATVTVEARDNDFEAKHLQIAAGTTVTFSNVGRNQHDIVVSEPVTFDFGKVQEEFEPGTSYDVTFDEPGTYPYYCSLHATATAGSMRGVITVTE